MQPEERDLASLWDMLAAARAAVQATRGLDYEAYLAN